RRLHLDRLRVAPARAELESGSVGRSSLPATTSVQQARVDQAVRAVSDTAGRGLSRGWADAMLAAARSHSSALPDALDRAVTATDLDLDRHRRWWQAVRVLQWLLVAAVVAGLFWLGSAFVLAYLQLPPLPRVSWGGLPAPTVLVVGGVLAGLLVAGVSRIGVEVGARRRTAAAQRTLHGAIGRVTRELVVEPVTAEVKRYEAARAALERSRG
ncbi:MAG: ABC transporter, partial [Actinomycetes bacterium]